LAYWAYVSLVVSCIMTPNAAPEWQARTLKRKEGIGGGLSTRGAG